MMEGPAEAGNAEGNGQRHIRTLKMADEYLDAVAMGHGTMKIADLTGLHPNTVSRRMQDPDWQDAVRLRRDTLLGSAFEVYRTQLPGLVGKAIEKLDLLLDASDPRVLVRAIAMTLEYASRLFDQMPTDLAPRPESNVDKLLEQPLTLEQVLAEISKAEAERDATEN